tara:strand:- start:381 stop:644 length:264 start_codon:yes stop_codon:yes gene_type:complete
MTKASMIAGIAGKVAYVATSGLLIAKSIGKKAYDRVNYRAKYYITICDNHGVVIMDTRRKSTREIIKILESLKDADIRITLERSKQI